MGKSLYGKRYNIIDTNKLGIPRASGEAVLKAIL